MARGTMYEVVTDKDAVNAMSASDFYYCLGELGCEYVMDRDEEMSELDLEPFLGQLKKGGLAIEKEWGEGPCLKIGPLDEGKLHEAKKSILHGLYVEFKKLAAAMTEDDFLKHEAAVGILSVLDDQYGDCVYLDGKIYTIARFIREMEPDTVYYIGMKTVLLH